MWVSDLFPQIAEVADELTVIKSMVAETANHIPGSSRRTRASARWAFHPWGPGCRMAWGPRTSLPSFVVLPDARGIPKRPGALQLDQRVPAGAASGSRLQHPGRSAILDLQPASGTEAEVQKARLELLEELDAIRLEEQSQTDPLTANPSYELAARMQSAIPEATDFAGEPGHIKDLYGLGRKECGDTARNCLTARRLIERGVRMVQLWTGDGVSWDAHDDITGTGYKSHTGEALRVDRPIAGLIRDLKNRGLSTRRSS